MQDRTLSVLHDPNISITFVAYFLVITSEDCRCIHPAGFKCK